MPESGTDTWISAPFTSSSSSSSLSLLGAFIHSFSGHTVLLHGPDVGRGANELGGSAQDSPCLLGPMDKACAMTRRPRERLDIWSWESHGPQHQKWRGEPGSSTGLQPFTQVGKERLPVSGRLPLPWWAAGTTLDDQESESQ